MLRLHKYRKQILIVEFIALAVLIGSMLTVKQLFGGAPPPALFWLVPIIASFLVISGFSANLYIRWVESTDKQSGNSTQKLFVYLLILTLYASWVFALIQAWQATNTLSQ